MDIRKQTSIIIRKNSEFLVGKICYSNELKWSSSPYDAWRTRDREEAAEVARATGGVMVLWNPIVKQMKVIGA